MTDTPELKPCTLCGDSDSNMRVSCQDCYVSRRASSDCIEECAKIADKWGRGEWLVQEETRKRFTLQDLQFRVNATGRGIAEDIRALAGVELGEKET